MPSTTIFSHDTPGKKKSLFNRLSKKFKSMDMYGRTIGLTYKGNE